MHLEYPASILATTDALLASPRAMRNLLSLVSRHDGDAMDLFQTLFRPITTNSDAQERIVHAVATSSKSAGVVEAYVKNLEIAKGNNTNLYAATVISSLTGESYASTSRAAAEAGAIPKLASLVQHHIAAPTYVTGGKLSDASAIKQQGLTALWRLTLSSHNRSTAAARAGVRELAAQLMRPREAPCVQHAALCVTHSLLRMNRPLSDDFSMARVTITNLAALLVKGVGQGYDAMNAREGLCFCLSRIMRLQPGVWDDTIGRALLAASASPVLVQHARVMAQQTAAAGFAGASDAAYKAEQPMALLASMVKACSSQQQTKQLCAAVAQAGGIQVAKDFIAGRAAAGMIQQCFRQGQNAAAAVVLMALGGDELVDYALQIGGDLMMDRPGILSQATASLSLTSAVREVRLNMCAKCGVKVGDRPDVKLSECSLICSSFRRWICDCQSTAWR